MALALSDLFGNPKDLAVEIAEGKTLNITYYPEFITEEFEARSHAMTDLKENQAKAIAELVCPVIASWDIEGLPFSRENAAKVPSLVLSKMLTAILTDVAPKNLSE